MVLLTTGIQKRGPLLDGIVEGLNDLMEKIKSAVGPFSDDLSQVLADPLLAVADLLTTVLDILKLLVDTLAKLVEI